MNAVSTGEGTATVEMVAKEEMANHAGFVHGGMIATLADSAMGRSVRTLGPEIKRALSFDLKMNFVHAAKVGETLRATGKVLHEGRRTVVLDCTVVSATGRLIATATATFLISRTEKEEIAD